MLLVVLVLVRGALLLSLLTVSVALRAVIAWREELERVERDFGHVAFLSARLVRPASVSESTFDIEAHALVDAELFEHIRDLAPAYDVVPLRIFFLFAVVVAIAAGGGEGEGHALASTDLAHADFRVLADVADEHNFVQISHVAIPLVLISVSVQLFFVRGIGGCRHVSFRENPGLASSLRSTFLTFRVP